MNSATVQSPYFGTFATLIPFSLQYPISTLLYPVDLVVTNLRSGIFLSKSPDAIEPVKTEIISASLIFSRLSSNPICKGL